MTDTMRFMDDRHAVAAEIRALMGRHRVSQSALAVALGMSQPSFSKRLNGHQSFDLDELFAVAKFFDVKVTDLAVMLMVQEGMRRGEVARLELGDFDMSHRLVTVTGKGQHQRVLHVTSQTMSALRDHLAVEGAMAGPLLRSRQFPTRALHPDTVSMLVRKAMERAGVKRAPRDGVSPHSLRHTSLTDMLLNGAHARDVQHVAGHQHLATTERYLPMAVGTLAATMDGRWYGPDA